MSDMTKTPLFSGVGRPINLSLSNWDSWPYSKWSFQHVREIVPTCPVDSDIGNYLSFDRELYNIEEITFLNNKQEKTSVKQFLEKSGTDGFLVLKNGKIICENYYNEMEPKTLHLGHSVSKSVVATIAGLLEHKNLISLESNVSTFLPECKSRAYGDVNLQQLLDMTSGVAFSEDTIDPLTKLYLMDIAVGWKHVDSSNPNPRNLRDLVVSLTKKIRQNGEQFDYRSLETNTLGLCLERATGRPLCDLISELLWKPMGAEFAADFAVDPAGFVIADGGLSASLRDFARFGLLYARKGIAQNGEQVIPESWIEKIFEANAEVFLTDQKKYWPDGAYHNNFWLPNVKNPVLMALGIWGQMIYIDTKRDFVGVKLSSDRSFFNENWHVDAYIMMRSLSLHLETIMSGTSKKV